MRSAVLIAMITLVCATLWLCAEAVPYLEQGRGLA